MSVAVKNNFQNYDPRHRLTGAVVLILLAIVLLPMLLNKKPNTETPEADHVVMEIKKAGKKVFVSRISSTTPTESTAVQRQSSGADTKDKGKQSSVLFEPMVTSAVPAKSTVKAPAKKSAAKKPGTKQSTAKKSKAVSASSWIVQVGVFSKSVNASKKVSELKKKGFSAKSGRVKTSKGTVTKVWIGPFKDRKAAEKMQDRLRHKTRQRGIVVKK